MTAVDDFLSAGPKLEPKRNRWGQYLLPHPTTGEETAFQRVTTFAKLMGDTYALDMWNRRMVAKGLTLRPDLHAQAAAATLDEKALLNQICEQAGEAAGTSEGRNKGSALHRFAERVDAGETDVAIPAPFDRDIAAYRQTMAAAGVECVPGMSERIVVIPELGVAGTFDRLLRQAAWPLDRIGDLKTAQSMYGWLEIAIQLACYAHGTAIFDLATQAYLPMPQVDKETAIVMHLPAGSGECRLYEVDIAAGWAAAQVAVAVRAWRKRNDLAKATEISTAPPSAVEADGGGGVRSGTPSAATPQPARGLVRSNLERKVHQIAENPALLMALQAELNLRGLPRLSEATNEQLPDWVKAVNAVLDDPFDGLPGPEPKVTVVVGQRASLTKRVHELTPDQIGVLGQRLVDRGLAGLSATADDHLDQWEEILAGVEAAAPIEGAEPAGDPQPPAGHVDMVDGSAPSPLEGAMPEGTATVSADRAVDGGTAPSNPLRDRYLALPADLQKQVEEARAGTSLEGVNIVFGGTPDQEALADKLIADAEVDHQARVDYIRALVDDFPPANVARIFAEVAGAIDIAEWTGVDVDRLEALVDAIDRTIVAFTDDNGEKPELTCSPIAVERLVDVHGNRGDVLKAARVHAKDLGRPTPRTAAAAAMDPLLAALTARKTA